MASEPIFKQGDRIRPLDNRSVWSRQEYELTVLDCFPSETRKGKFTIQVSVSHKHLGSFKVRQPAEDFYLERDKEPTTK